MKIWVPLMIVMLSQTGVCQDAVRAEGQASAAACASANATFENRVSHVVKVREDSNEAVFAFDTVYGTCQDGVVSPLKLAQNASVMLFDQRVIFLQKNPVQSSLEVLSPTRARIKLTFDTNKTFKDRDVAAFSMIFFPTGYRPRMNNYPAFNWQLELRHIDADTSSLSLRRE